MHIPFTAMLATAALALPAVLGEVHRKTGWYNAGVCHIHVRQWKAHDHKDRKLKFTLKDDLWKEIGKEKMTAKSGGKYAMLNTPLPYDMTITAPSTDFGPVHFEYNDDKWNSYEGATQKGPRCWVGDYDTHHRDMDCNFNCPRNATDHRL